jgi:hypothetical protein
VVEAEAASAEEVPAVAGRRHRRVRAAVDAAENLTGLQFAIYLGPSPGDPRELAERLFAGAGEPAVLVVVATTARRVEILTAEAVRARVSDEACAEAIELMRPFLAKRAWDRALLTCLDRLVAAAGPGAPMPGAIELPDVFDEG